MEDRHRTWALFADDGRPRPANEYPFVQANRHFGNGMIDPEKRCVYLHRMERWYFLEPCAPWGDFGHHMSVYPWETYEIKSSPQDDVEFIPIFLEFYLHKKWRDADEVEADVEKMNK